MKFANRADAKAWIAQRSAAYPSMKAFYASEEYRIAYPAIQAAYKIRKKTPAQIVPNPHGSGFVVKTGPNAYLASGRGTFSGIQIFDSREIAEKQMADRFDFSG